MSKYVHRDAISGRFVDEGEAAEKPATTMRQKKPASDLARIEAKIDAEAKRAAARHREIMAALGGQAARPAPEPVTHRPALRR